MNKNSTTPAEGGAEAAQSTKVNLQKNNNKTFLITPPVPPCFFSFKHFYVIVFFFSLLAD